MSTDDMKSPRGGCGKNVFWFLDEDTGALRITGTGPMNDLLSYYSEPWRLYASSIRSVAIEPGVTSIGDWMFSDCTNLTSCTIPDSVTSIGRLAFYGCTSLTPIDIPDSVLKIGHHAFYQSGCYAQEYLEDGALYMGNHLISTPGVLGKEYEIKPGTVTIADIAFYKHSKLESVTIPNGVKAIGEKAFYHCTNLKSITIPNSVVKIWKCAFEGCENVTEMTLPFIGGNIPNSAYIGYYFGGDDDANTPSNIVPSTLQSVVLTDDCTVVPTNAFSFCTFLTSIKLGNRIAKIGANAFSNCRGLTSLEIPDSVTEIGESAFSHCTGLTEITIPANVVFIGKLLFSHCENLTSIAVDPNNQLYADRDNCLIEKSEKSLIAGCKTSVIPNDGSVTSIGYGAFSGCIGLTAVTIPDRIVSIEPYAFSGCEGISSLTVPGSVTSIGDYAFLHCRMLSSLNLFEGVADIGKGAFNGCLCLESVVLPDSVTTVGESAFWGCTLLSSVTISDHVVSIGALAFRNTRCEGDLANRVNGVFYLGNHLISASNMLAPFDVYTVREGTKTIAPQAFSYLNQLAAVTIPDSVLYISSFAFTNCSALNDVYYTGTKQQWETVTRDLYGTDSLLHVAVHLDNGETLYRVSYELNGGVQHEENSIYYVSQAQTLLHDPVKTGYVFDGWYEDKAFKTRVATISQGSTGSKTLYAKWQLKEYPIIYDLKGGDNHTGNPATYTMNDAFSLQDATRKGYVFSGWYRDQGMTKRVFEISRGSTGSLSLFAKWTPVSYGIIYKLNGGKNVKGNPTAYTVASSTVTLKTPTRKGYTFKGWYRDSKYKTKVTQITKGSTGDKTLYAKWEKETYKITYKLNGGKNVKGNPTAFTVTSSTVTLKAPTRKGYIFKGWYSDSKWKTKITKITKGSTGNKTLYAKWKKK